MAIMYAHWKRCPAWPFGLTKNLTCLASGLGSQYFNSLTLDLTRLLEIMSNHWWCSMHRNCHLRNIENMRRWRVFSNIYLRSRETGSAHQNALMKIVCTKCDDWYRKYTKYSWTGSLKYSVFVSILTRAKHWLDKHTTIYCNALFFSACIVNNSPWV